MGVEFYNFDLEKEAFGFRTDCAYYTKYNNFVKLYVMCSLIRVQKNRPIF